MKKIKIVEVVNLIPIQIKFEIDGVLEKIMGYIDYDSYSIVIDDPRFQPVIQDLKQLVIDYLVGTQSEKDAALVGEVPVEIYQQLNKGASCKVDDYLNPQLNVQLKEENGKHKT